MDVEDAFTEEAISALGTNVADETEAELKDIITRIYTTNEIAPVTDDHVNVAMLCFVAGRTYQSDQQEPAPVSVEMTPQLASEFIHFLVERGAP
jgi:hypothetical protein